MSWLVPVALEGASDLSGNAFAILFVFIFPGMMFLGLLTIAPFFGPLLEGYVPLILGLWFGLSMIPILIYYVVLVFYYIYLAGDWLWFESSHLSLNVYHRVFMAYLRCLKFVREVSERLAETCHSWTTSLLNTTLLSRLTMEFLIRPRRRQWQTTQLLATKQDKSDSDASSADAIDHCMPSRVCEGCARVLRNSQLLLGSHLLVVRREEKHDLERTLDELRKTSETQFCHLCTTLWNSMSLEEQVAARELERQQQATRRSIEDLEQQPLLYQTGSKLRLVIQEKSGASCGLCMQLYLDEVAIGPLIPIEQTDTGPCEVQLGRTTKSAQCVNLAQEWLRGCKGAHQHCTNSINTEFLPSRLVHVEPSSPSAPLRLRLVETDSLQEKPAYLALSHCWGSTMKVTLTSHNRASLLQNINLDDLSLNFQHAAEFSVMMGYSYIWIDSICIIQRCFEHTTGSACNSSSKADWEHESKQMGDVYAAADCTISACASADSSGGCFRTRNPLVYFPCHILVEKPNGGTTQRSLTVRTRRDEYWTNTFQTQVDQSPLSGRAWAFQERMLSRRMIHFGASMIFFECATLFASEQQTSGIYDGKDILAADGSRHKYPDLCRWSDMLAPFLPTPVPTVQYEDSGPMPKVAPNPRRPPPLRQSRLPTPMPSKHERQKRNVHRRKVREHSNRISARLDEYETAIRRHIARLETREAVARQRHEIALAQAAAAPRKANPAYVAPEVMASLADSSVTGYRGAFEFLKATAATASQAPTTEPRDQLRLHQRWFELVAKYTRSALTVAADRPAAIAGIATAIQGSSGNDEGLAVNEYLAGLWRRHFIFDLLWSAEQGGKPCTQRPADYRAPSWSWMSIDKPVSQQLLPFTIANEARECDINLLAEVQDICLLDKDQNRVTDSTTTISDGWLDIYGALCPVSEANFTGRDNWIRLSLDTKIRAHCSPDLELLEEDIGLEKVLCLPILIMHRKPLGPESEGSRETQAPTMHGIVVRYLPDRQGHKVCERIGTFTLEAEDAADMEAVSKGISEMFGERTVRIL